MTPEEEAAEIFAETVRELVSRDHDLQGILRRCFHACRLINWNTEAAWFHRELTGYSDGDLLPPYREVHGRLDLQVKHPAFPEEPRYSTVYEAAAHHRSAVHVDVDLPGLSEPGVREQEPYRELKSEDPATVQLVRGIDWLLVAATTGYRDQKGLPATTWEWQPNRFARLEVVRVFEAAEFARVVAEIEHRTFDFASRVYRVLRYGNALADIWADYRRHVEAALKGLGLTDHLEAIEGGIRADNPQAWRNAVFGCRNLLTDVANHLWQDERETYEHLPGDDRGGKLKVTPDRFVNRLAAYLHQKGVTAARGKFVRDELARVAASIRSLVALQSEAHAPITREDARSVVLATYFILGELATKTDMVPIAAYGEPGLAKPS